MQNLDGEDSLIGRSLTFTNENAQSYCCVIALDMGPSIEEPEAPVPENNHSHH